MTGIVKGNTKKKYRNGEVVGYFLLQRPATGEALSTDGHQLWSYILPIGVWDTTNKGRHHVRMPAPERWYTSATLSHRGMLKATATAMGIPVNLN